ncbi:MAG: nucleoside triphosphate pyrophosphohydrolase [Bacteroidales bacterium]|nr:nucleoside triphosphate pyrophosphohydrolase [Bacteroidales bacterium]
MSHTKEEKIAAFERALEVMDTLREKCPWNHAQTNESLRPLTIEEVYELSDAVLAGGGPSLCKEVGDLSLHVLFYAKVAEEKGEYDIADVLNGMCEKMIFRHPHVFGDASGRQMSAEEVAKAWELRKKQERDGKTILEGVPRSCEPLQKAFILQDKASAVGFDWEKPDDVWPKVDEEICEAKEAVGLDVPKAPGRSGSTEVSSAHAEEEFGDALFALVNACRMYGVDPSVALGKACDKFRRRFTYMETEAAARGLDLGKMSLAEMDAIWDEGKAKGL